MKKSIFFSKRILLAASLLLLTVECRCPSNQDNRKLPNETKHLEQEQAKKIVNDLRAIFQNPSTPSPSNSSNTKTQGIGESVDITGNEVLGPETLQFYNDIATKDGNLEGLRGLLYSHRKR
ncbi:MAG: hypothetical protein NMK33_00200 [Candidatus Cardinium sp.]|uniref:hypothetical protein n=1 Tax=Cardinium endosymbiont of Dermatophagoides farinae TaxID=2597823 RepID=UPI0011820E43|nr:hypothetical protein [Cardinium endosymbiont of Dermatophagoides farinae]TSJ80958.1 hypothetical protein FPG78_02880 [Cardinium endosymbiont of Dermatophagoides farinae]UWW96984.1 MAG: hypothetical protein NMK33_00200 [Candidatus Cardinium sp.]